jgi:hypothetical protein
MLVLGFAFVGGQLVGGLCPSAARNRRSAYPLPSKAGNICWFCAAVERALPVRVDLSPNEIGEIPMNGVIYLVGLVVVVLAILSFFGLR